MDNTQKLESWVSEMDNLEALYKNAFEALSKLGQGGHFDAWKFRRVLKGYYDFDPFPNWKGKKVRVTKPFLYGEGTIIAAKKVGNWYIIGVEFPEPVAGGHSLMYQDEGDRGRDGCCVWVWPGNLEFVH